jgi:hypothetical protein
MAFAPLFSVPEVGWLGRFLETKHSEKQHSRGNYQNTADPN